MRALHPDIVRRAGVSASASWRFARVGSRPFPAPSRFGGSPGGDSMITRQGRSASTYSSVEPKIDRPVRRSGGDITIALARISRASATIRRPASPRRTFSQCPVTRRPPSARAARIVRRASVSSWRSSASIGTLAGTVSVTSTWIPRRREAASLIAVATSSGW